MASAFTNAAARVPAFLIWSALARAGSLVGSRLSKRSANPLMEVIALLRSCESLVKEGVLEVSREADSWCPALTIARLRTECQSDGDEDLIETVSWAPALSASSRSASSLLALNAISALDGAVKRRVRRASNP